MELEYTAMSMALWSVIPLLAVIELISGGRNYNKHKLLTFKATVHEDNQGALILANLKNGRFTPCSKFNALKLHWFRLWLKPREIEVIFIPILEQKIDFLFNLSSCSFPTKLFIFNGTVIIFYDPFLS